MRLNYVDTILQVRYIHGGHCLRCLSVNSLTATCYKQENCSSHGICVDLDVCRCDLGWTSSNCSRPSCEILNWCSGHGQCIALDVCLCESGWTDNSSSTPDCSAQNDCSNHGDCLQPGTCSCHPGYDGTNCSTNAKCKSVNNCNDHGLCLATSGLKDNSKQSLLKCRYVGGLQMYVFKKIVLK